MAFIDNVAKKQEHTGGTFEDLFVLSLETTELSNELNATMIQLTLLDQFKTVVTKYGYNESIHSISEGTGLRAILESEYGIISGVESNKYLQTTIKQDFIKGCENMISDAVKKIVELIKKLIAKVKQMFSPTSDRSVDNKLASLRQTLKKANEVVTHSDFKLSSEGFEHSSPKAFGEQTLFMASILDQISKILGVDFGSNKVIKPTENYWTLASLNTAGQIAMQLVESRRNMGKVVNKFADDMTAQVNRDMQRDDVDVEKLKEVLKDLEEVRKLATAQTNHALKALSMVNMEARRYVVEYYKK